MKLKFYMKNLTRSIEEFIRIKSIIIFIFFSDEKITIEEKEFTITRQMFTFQIIDKTIQGTH